MLGGLRERDGEMFHLEFGALLARRVNLLAGKVDLLKCFDRVPVGTALRALRRFGLPEEIEALILSFYDGLEVIMVDQVCHAEGGHQEQWITAGGSFVYALAGRGDDSVRGRPGTDAPACGLARVCR